MALVVFQTRRVKEALKAPSSLAIDLLVLLIVGALIGAMFSFGRQVAAPYQQKVEISLSYWALPKYTMFSLARGVAAYGLSLLFTLVYGTYAAHHHRAEKAMIPALDVLQSIPVLGFLPGLVLAMVNIFPTREIGLEIACVIMIFTAQAWNMTFSFFGSLRGIPGPLREVTQVHNLGWWRVFKILELPAAMIGLVWNSMMSMAGGWFFLTVNEAFTLGDRDFRLPGIGSYMAEAINQNNRSAMFAAVVAMIIMIVVVDQFFWRPVVVWSERFKIEETAEVDKAQSWVLSVLRRSRLCRWLVRALKSLRKPADPDPGVTMQSPEPAAPPDRALRPIPVDYNAQITAGKSSTMAWLVIQWLLIGLVAVGTAWGGWKLLRLLIALPLHDASTHEDWLSVILALGATFLRTTAAVLIGALWALPVGIAIGLSPRWSQRLQPVVQVVASFPAPMLFPIVTIVMLALRIPFGIGCVSLMLLGAQWYILFNVIAGAMAIPGDLKEVGMIYRTPRLQQWMTLYIPCVFPYLVTGLVTAAGGAWNATIVSEYVQVRGNTYAAFGLGSIISQATSKGNFPLLAGGIVTMAISVVFLNRLIWKRLYRISESRFSLNI